MDIDSGALPPPPLFQFDTTDRISQLLGRVSPCGALYGRAQYWNRLQQLYRRERTRIRAIVPDGQWIAFSFEWLDETPHVWFESKEAATRASVLALVLRPGYEADDLAPSYPAVIM